MLRRYSKRARKDYLAFAKSKKHSTKQIRKALRKQFAYVARDIRYLDEFMSDGYAMNSKEIKQYLTIVKLYEQQQYIYDNKVHSVEHHIVSILQPWLRPIVRGKVKAPVITRSVCWQIRYTEPERTGTIVKSRESAYLVQSLEDQVLIQKLIKNKSIRIIPIELKWNVPLA